ncbi:hypothetical protein MGYG_00084 [Nannizzia gypsea CBS 118893]|uniref:ERCC4 domain-containing protein n=1 Tax=Arthroderma gypseum (strain ATCC MYA-4604 / CBS 118893) TaxID=535722 RepID=E5R2Q6_ARTGP|nr:hypothetical protein MGYG_00084 [Nannizzia gypsea CBS 118893]EFQ97040.1 hypothetical protein MGYG_00084 [Nannizzia gypsea CBS 118893]
MVQVISLLSSSPAVVPKRPANESLEASFGILDSPLNAPSERVDDSLFEYGDFIDSSATKRRRLSPPVDRNVHTTNHITPLKSPGFIFSDISDFNSIGNTPIIPPATSKPKETANKASTSWDLAQDDPILCSSSAPNNQVQEETSKKPATIVIDDDDDDNDDFLGLNLAPLDDIDDNNDDDDDDLFDLGAPRSSKFGISKQTSRLLEQLRREAESKGKAKKKQKKEDDFDSLSEGDALPPTKQKPVGRPSSSQTAGRNLDKSAKTLEREAAKLRRQNEKELQKEEKRKQKEEKEKQKRIAADIAEANKSKVDKAVSVGEMIVDISSSFQDSSIGTQTGEHMRNLGVEMHFTSTGIPNVVSWRRKVTAQFTEAGHWEPCAPTIKPEGHVLCFFTGDEFAEMSVAPTGGNTAKAYFQKVKGAYPNRKQIYLIEGLSTSIRKGKNSRNRSYQAAVLQQIDNNQANSGATGQPQPPPASATTSQSKRKKAASSKKTGNTAHVIDEDAIEDALLQLQVIHSCLVHETSNATETALWIKNFTEHISTVPYRQELMRNQDASFCMDVGQVRSGDDAGDAYVRMMQEVSRITAPIAYGVATQYPTVGRLVDAFDKGGALLLEDVKKCANKTGAMTDARIGPAISRRLYTIFTSLDPASSDV